MEYGNEKTRNMSGEKSHGTENTPVQGARAGVCPNCGSDLVWRVAMLTGELYRGCTNYDGGCRYNDRSY